MGYFVRETVEIRNKPQLTIEEAIQAFSKNYKVYHLKSSIGIDFTVVKGDWAGVNVNLVQKQGKTLFKFAWYPTSVLGRLGGIIVYYAIGKSLESEIREFIRNEPAFK